MDDRAGALGGKLRNLFTKEEIVLCTYSAMYASNDFGGINKIYLLKHRSISSIKMKIMNIASMLDENGIRRFNYDSVPPLTGLTTGQTGRRTNWNIVATLYPLLKEDFLKKCNMIVGN